MTNLILILLVVNITVLAASKLLKKKPVTADGIAVDTVPEYQRPRGERFSLIARVMRGRKESSLIERNLVTASVMLKPSEFFAINIATVIVLCTLALFYLGFYWPNDGALFTLAKRVAFFCVMVVVGWKGPQMILQLLADKRRSTLEYQLADALTIVSSALKGGYSFVQGLDMAASQMPEPIKGEVERVLRLIQLGLDTTRALEQLAYRVNSYDYDITVSATNIQLTVGGNLSQLLEGVAATIRDRIRLRRDVSALTAQGRISGGILFVLPIGIAFFLAGINWDYMKELFTKEMGHNLLYLAGGLQAAGFFWIKKLLDFDN